MQLGLAIAALFASIFCVSAPARAACNLLDVAELPVTMRGPTPLVPAKINGSETQLILDTGAFYSILAPKSAKRFDLRPGGLEYRAQLQFRGANGAFLADLVNVTELTVLNRKFKDVRFLIGGSELDSEISGLLGQNFLNIEDGEYDLANGVMRIFRPQDCAGANLAYWAAGQPYSVIPISLTDLRDRRIRGHATVNGTDIRVGFDTGSPDSYLSLDAAARAGLHPKDPGAKRGGLTGGMGRGSIESWIVPVKNFKIGDEEIRSTRLRIGDIRIGDMDMLLGADFFLSHRVFVSNSQHQLYFTYNGGPVFNLGDDGAPAGGDAKAGAPSTFQSGSAAGAPTGGPTDAAAIARRGQALAARHAYTEALAALNRAVELAPDDAQILLDRGRIYVEHDQPKLAMADFDRAVTLKPRSVPIRLARADLHLKNKELAAARADFEAALSQDSTLRLQIANDYSGEGDFEDAVALFGALLASKPNAENRLWALEGRCWSRALWNRDLDNALADCDQALAPPYSSWPPALDGRAMVRFRMRQYDRALQDYDRVIKVGYRTAWAYYGRGLTLIALGRITEGQADLTAASDLDSKLAVTAKGYGLTSDVEP